MSRALGQGSQVPDPWRRMAKFGGKAWTAKHDRDGVPNCGYTRGQRVSVGGKYAVASAPRRPATPSSDWSRGRSRALGSRMPRLAAGGPGLTPGLHMFQLVQREWEETGMHVRDLWAGHPEIAGVGVHHVQAVSSRATPSPLSRRQAARNPVCQARNPVAATRFTTASETQRPSPQWERAFTCEN